LRLTRGVGIASEALVIYRVSTGTLNIDFPVHPMLIDQIRANKSAIDQLGVKYGARRIRVFGSVARGAERPDSDIDFLVDFDRGYDLFAQRLPLARHLESLLGRPVEVIPEHELNRHIRDRVLSEAVDL
jgi:predicted nucleotidyltransferase